MSYKIVAKQPSILWSDINEINDRIDAKYYHCDYMVFNIKNYGEFEIKSLKQCVNFFETGVSNFNDGNIKLKRLKTSNIQNGFILYQDLTDCVVPERDKKKILCKGDVVLTTYGTGSIGKVAYVNFDTQIIPDYTIAILRTKKTIDSGYLASFLGSIYGKQQIMRRVIGTSGITLVIKPHLIDIQIPIPSPEIQKYIGDKVRKAEELREEAKRLKKQAEEILINEIGFNNVNKGNAKYHWIKEDIVDDRIDSDFYDLKYQVLIEIEKKFNCYLMEDIIVDKYTGKTPGKEYDDIKGIPLIVVKNVEENILNLDNIDRRIKDNNSFKKTEENDLLITRVGSVGVVSIVEENEKGLFLSDNVICLKLKEGLFNRYIAFYLNSIYGKLMVERWTKGAVQGVINYESINKFKIPIMDNNIMKEIDLKILKWKQLLAISKQLIQEAKQDVEDLIEGNFDMSKVKA